MNSTKQIMRVVVITLCMTYFASYARADLGKEFVNDFIGLGKELIFDNLNRAKQQEKDQRFRNEQIRRNNQKRAQQLRDDQIRKNNQRRAKQLRNEQINKNNQRRAQQLRDEKKRRSEQRKAQELISKKNILRQRQNKLINAAARTEPKISQQQVFILQQQLNKLGHNTGTPDGSIGKNTRRGIQRYQKYIGAAVTGFLSQKQLNELSPPRAIAEEQPTLDCNNVTTSAERRKCRNNKKSAQFAQHLNEIYARVLPPANQVQFKSEKRDWLAEKEQCGIDDECLAAGTPQQLTRYWEGRLLCGRGSRTNRDLTLDIMKSDSDRYKATLTEYFSSSDSGIANWDFYVGEFDPEKNTYFFARTGKKLWGLRGASVQTFSLSGLKEGSVQLELSDKQCPTINLNPVDDLANKRFAISPKGKGTFYQAVGTRAKCNALMKWADSFSESMLSRKKKDWALLFTDKAFIPVFGKPYEDFSIKGRKNFYKKDLKYGRLCGADPLIKARFGNASTAVRVGFSSELIQVNYIQRQVEQNRLIHNKVRNLKIDMLSLEGSDKSLSSYATLIDFVKKNELLISPSGFKKANTLIEDERSKVAKKLAFQQYEELIFLSNPLDQLTRINNYKSDPPNYIEFLDKQDKEQLDLRYTKLGKQLSNTRLQPLTKQVDEVEETVDGVLEIQKIVKESSIILKALDSTEQKKYETKFQLRSETIISKLVNVRLKLLQELPDTKLGIAESDSWLDKFNKEFSRFLDEKSVKGALHEYSQIRSKRLLNAFAGFELSLKEIDKSAPDVSSSISALLKQYLTSEKDFRNPISLDYLFAIESFQPNSQLN